jgi:acyl carrier protein
MNREEVRDRIHSFVTTNFLPGEDPATLDFETPLVSSGILTSLALLELVTYLEEEFCCVILPEQVGIGRMDSIERLVDLVTKSSSARSASR